MEDSSSKSEVNKKEEKKDESKANNAPSFPDKYSDKLYNSIARISISLTEKEKMDGTGFFIELNLKNTKRYFLMTCHHIIPEKIINEEKIINLHYRELNKEKNLEIKLHRDKRLIKCFEEPFDVTMIEILDEDNIKKDKFLIPDLNYKNDYISYLNNNVYSVRYPEKNFNKNETSISYGKITKILEKPEFELTFNKGQGNTGSPICLANNISVVGIYKKGNKNQSINYGTFLGHIIDILEKE